MRFFIIFLLLCSICIAAPPKVIVFDYGGVIARIDRRPVLKYISESLEKGNRKVKKDFASEKLYQAFNKPKSFWEEYAGRSLPETWFRELEDLKKLVIQEIPGMKELLTKIKSQGIQIAILSNTNTHRARFIESMGGYDLFDPILLSCYLEAKKPEPKVYEKLLKSLGSHAKECLFIDNRPCNVEASRKFGIDGIVFQSVDKLKEELKKREVKLE